jgi:uncharacterized membrane protein YhiD involved in acid resistance
MVPRTAAISVSSEVDMSKSSIIQRGNSHHTAAAVWILAGIVALVAFGDVVAVLAIALAMVTLALWAFREVEHRVERDDAHVASVTRLRPASTGRVSLQHASTQLGGPRAA